MAPFEVEAVYGEYQGDATCPGCEIPKIGLVPFPSDNRCASSKFTCEISPGCQDGVCDGLLFKPGCFGVKSPVPLIWACGCDEQGRNTFCIPTLCYGIAIRFTASTLGAKEPDAFHVGWPCARTRLVNPCGECGYVRVKSEGDDVTISKTDPDEKSPLSMQRK